MSSIIDAIKNLIIENASRASYIETYLKSNDCCLIDFIIDGQYVSIEFFYTPILKEWKLYEYPRGWKEASEKILTLLKKEPPQ